MRKPKPLHPTFFSRCLTMLLQSVLKLIIRFFIWTDWYLPLFPVLVEPLIGEYDLHLNLWHIPDSLSLICFSSLRYMLWPFVSFLPIKSLDFKKKYWFSESNTSNADYITSGVTSHRIFQLSICMIAFYAKICKT